MSHHIYHTRGLILGSTQTGESNRFYKIFTEELGLVGATAQSVREGKSKLRYVLQNFSWITVDLVRGREVWRITSAGEERIMPYIKNSDVCMKLFARACSLVSRLVHGEGQNKDLFNELASLTAFLESGAFNVDLESSFETLMALRILVHLGYQDGRPYEAFLNQGLWSNEILEAFEKIRLDTIPRINEALTETQL